MAHADGLYYERHGAGDPLLLITGWTISAAVFEPLLDLYAKHFECIVYDHRGSARSEGSSPATMGALADDAARLLTALRIPRALVNGLSMGGMVAQEVALRHAGRERGEALIGYFKRHRSSVKTIAAQTLASARFDSTLRLDRIRAPTLVMHGERDRLVPLAASRLLAARIPDAELAVVPGTGHAFGLEAPQESLDLLLGWVERRLSRTVPREEAHVAPDR